MFNIELTNINNIIITKSLEFFSNIRDCNIIEQLKILYEIKEEYIKLVKDTKDDITNNEISDIFNKFDKKTIYYKIVYNSPSKIDELLTEVKEAGIETNLDNNNEQIKGIFGKLENDRIRDAMGFADYTLCNVYDRSDVIDEETDFFIYRQNEDMIDNHYKQTLYKVVNILNYKGSKIYTVEVYKGKFLRGVMDDQGRLCSVIKFEDEIIDIETNKSQMYTDNRYSYVFGTEMRTYKYKDFDFNMPLKVLVPDDEIDDKDVGLDDESSDGED